MTNVGGATNTLEAQSRNMMNICTKYGFDILIISGSYGGHRTHDVRRRTTPRVWHKLPQLCELKKIHVTGHRMPLRAMSVFRTLLTTPKTYWTSMLWGKKEYLSIIKI